MVRENSSVYEEMMSLKHKLAEQKIIIKLSKFFFEKAHFFHNFHFCSRKKVCIFKDDVRRGNSLVSDQYPTQTVL